MGGQSDLGSFDASAWLLGGGALILAGIAALLYIYLAVALTVMSRKSGTDHAWLSWLPGLNLLQMCRIGRSSLFWAVLMLVPLLNIIAIAVIWSAIAKARGKSGVAGFLILVPLINLFVPLWLAMGPSTADAGYVQNAVAGTAAGPRRCPSCQSAAAAADAFCGNCGHTLTPASAPVPMAAAPASAPAKSSGMGWLAAAGCFGFLGLSMMVCCGGMAALVFWPTSYSAPARVAPKFPARIAGTRTVFPLDTAATPARPTSVASQNFRDAGGAKLEGPVNTPAQQLPSGLAPAELPNLSTAVTSATYRESPSAAPVYVHVLNTAEDPAASQKIRDAVAATGTTTGQQVTTPTGEVYSGVRTESGGSVTHVLSNPTNSQTVVLYAPDPAAAPTADRLAGNVGNGQGLDDPELELYTCVLPAEELPQWELVNLQTITGEEMRASAEQGLRMEGPQDDVQVAQILNQLQQFIPNVFLAAQYRHVSGEEWNLLSFDYGQARRAWWIWQLANWTLGSTVGAQQSVQGTTGFYFADLQGSCLIFQKGPYLIILTGSANTPADQLAAWGDALQL